MRPELVYFGIARLGAEIYPISKRCHFHPITMEIYCISTISAHSRGRCGTESQSFEMHRTDYSYHDDSKVAAVSPSQEGNRPALMLLLDTPRA